MVATIPCTKKGMVATIPYTFVSKYFVNLHSLVSCQTVLHKEIPFLRIGIPLCAGIITGLYVQPGLLFITLTSLIIAAGFLVSKYFNRAQANTLFGVTLTTSLFLCGLLLYRNEKNTLSELNSEEITINGIISDYPLNKQNSYLLRLKMKSGNQHGTNRRLKGSIVIYCKKDSSVLSYLPGDRLLMTCSPVEITNRGNPYEFDYKFFMENHGIKYIAFASIENIKVHEQPKHRKLVHRALMIRERIISMYEERGIRGEQLALVSAMTLGQKNMLDQEQKHNFMKAGVMHIMAVSGLHAIILSLFVFNILFFLKGKYNIVRIVITIVILWAFAFVTGLTPSVLRATLMFTFFQAGNMMHRKVNGINSVLASAFVLIIIRPSVIFDAGFLLSYSAVIYIIMFYRELYLKLHIKSRFTDKIWQSAVVTIVAQAGTLPLTIMLFNRFSTYFLLTNIIIVPVSSLLIIVGCIIPLTFPVLFLSEILARLLNYLTILTDWLTATAASAVGSSIENIGLTTPDTLLLTIFIFILSAYFLLKPRFSILYPLVALAIIMLVGTVRELNVRYSNEIIVYNTPGLSSVGVRSGKILYLYSDSSIIAPDVRKHAATLRLKIVSRSLTENSYYLQQKKRNIFIGNIKDLGESENAIPNISILSVLPEIKQGNNDRPAARFAVFTSGVSVGKPSNFRRLSDSLYIVKKEGAYIKGL